jgi:hypothetical protein
MVPRFSFSSFSSESILLSLLLYPILELIVADQLLLLALHVGLSILDVPDVGLVHLLQLRLLILASLNERINMIMELISNLLQIFVVVVIIVLKVLQFCRIKEESKI